MANECTCKPTLIAPQIEGAPKGEILVIHELDCKHEPRVEKIIDEQKWAEIVAAKKRFSDE